MIHTTYRDIKLLGNCGRPDLYDDDTPAYYEENLFLGSAAVYDKGQRFIKCCEYLKRSPEQTEVIFVDNSQQELDAMRSMAKNNNIRLLNLHYKGAALKNADFIKIDNLRNTNLNETDKAKARRNAGRDIIEYANLKAESDDTMEFMELEQYLNLIEAHIDNLDKDDQLSTIEATDKFILTYRDQLEANEIIKKYKEKRLGK